MSSKTSTVFSKPTESSSSTKRHRKAAVACIACKVRKIRCSGSAPCETCVSLDTKCIIDETLDGRRKVALNRRLEELFHYKWILEALLLCLRSCRGKHLVAILELLSNGSPMPLLAAALCSLLGQCRLPAENSKEIAELQQNLTNYVQENESVISSMSEHDPNDLTPEDYRPHIGDEMTPPMKPPRSATAMEPDTSSPNPYLPIRGSPNFLFRRPSNFLGESTRFPGSLGADIASVAEDVGLNVIIDCMKGACIELPSHDLFNGYLAHCNSFVFVSFDLMG
ncbi:hypothetical protein LTR84_012198 [Exophiala bonariae]|uniref:Zn(2)-C6 fungal-type domain-containing protein n=1 Tax=Exophiala bonariae TaxID=1690606 RepID=A0AAV9NJ70_9EURO|nr:hypothetical protein LTR84_012198 [Exophiala bonariae]